ncbi:MAG: hypothetical protein JWN78_1975 [Bacteroidota bacterium]|nr:hypothetical protein [Bacteroidota bacterium]
MDNIIRIKIEHTQRKESSGSAKETFWASFQESYRKSQRENNDNSDSFRSIESYETSIERNFGRELSDSLIRFCSRGIDNVDRRYYEEFYRKQYRNKGYPDDFRNTLYKNDPSYREAINKSILASQIIIKTTDIGYGSLSLGIIIEPIDKLLDIFDNNFDLMRIFFESYVPTAFIESIYDNPYPDKYSDIPLSFYYDFPQNIKRQQIQEQQPTVKQSFKDKLDKTKFLTGLFKSTILLPVFLTLFILYFAFQKIDTANNVYLKDNAVIQQQKEEVIKGYKELLEQYKSDSKKDTASNKTKK